MWPAEQTIQLLQAPFRGAEPYGQDVNRVLTHFLRRFRHAWTATIEYKDSNNTLRQHNVIIFFNNQRLLKNQQLKSVIPNADVIYTIIYTEYEPIDMTEPRSDITVTNQTEITASGKPRETPGEKGEKYYQISDLGKNWETAMRSHMKKKLDDKEEETRRNRTRRRK